MLRYLTGLLAGCLFVFLALPLAIAAPIDMGEPFPTVALPVPADPAQRAYLGLEKERTFTLDQVEGKVVLVEILNVLCPHCQKQTAPYNELYKRIESDPETRGRIKMLGVAVANSAEQIEDFVDIYSVAYPVVADRRFALHRAVRGGPTPFSIYVLRDKPGAVGVVAGTHLGEDPDMNELFIYLKELLGMRVADFSALPREAVPPVQALQPPQSAGEIERRIKASFSAQGTGLEDFRKIELPSDRRVYTASIIRKGRRVPVFAEVTSRSAICDVCHNVHFFYVFDSQGIVLAFEPLHLTKYGNVEWNREEEEKFAKNVVGKPLDGTWDFDPKVDAVTSATMTSAIIFDSFDQGRKLLKELRAQGRL